LTHARKRSRLVAVVTGVATWLAVTGCPALTGPDNSDTVANVPLTPAHSLVGTWKTALPIPVTLQTDACGNRQNVGRADWIVTWQIREVAGFTNVIDVDMSVQASGVVATGTCGLVGWVPYTSNTIRLCLSSSQINGCSGTSYERGLARGPFTQDLLSVTWTHYECLIVCYGEFTGTNEMKLVRRP
jgi:hypothetical protein